MTWLMNVWAETRRMLLAFWDSALGATVMIVGGVVAIILAGVVAFIYLMLA